MQQKNVCVRNVFLTISIGGIAIQVVTNRNLKWRELVSKLDINNLLDE